MIEALKGYPDDVLAISGTGRITAQDYRDLLIPEARRRIEKHGVIRLFCYLGPQFEGLTAGAAWSDLKFGISRWNEIGRIAVVTDAKWIKVAFRLFAPIFHHAVRTFPGTELDRAAQWIVAKDNAE
jgi:hypothetical protein